MTDDICKNNHGGNEESEEAYRSSSAEQRERMREKVYSFAVRRGTKGITADEVSIASQLVHNRVAPRISELKRDGRLVPTAVRRKTRFGKSARVLVADVIAEKLRNANV